MGARREYQRRVRLIAAGMRATFGPRAIEVAEGQVPAGGQQPSVRAAWLAIIAAIGDCPDGMDSEAPSRMAMKPPLAG